MISSSLYNSLSDAARTHPIDIALEGCAVIQRRDAAPDDSARNSGQGLYGAGGRAGCDLRPYPQEGCGPRGRPGADYPRVLVGQHAVLRFPVCGHPAYFKLVQLAQSGFYRNGDSHLPGVDLHRRRAATAFGRDGPRRSRTGRCETSSLQALFGCSPSHRPMDLEPTADKS